MHLLTVVLLIFCEINVYSNSGFTVEANTVDYTYEKEPSTVVKIGKCCELNELLKDDKCISLNETEETQVWRPESIYDDNSSFERNKQKKDKLPSYELKIGLPRCESGEQEWHVYHSQTGSDRLSILPSGKLRHYVIKSDEDEVNKGRDFYLDEDAESEIIHYDYQFGHYCADKAILSRDGIVNTYAMVCVPQLKTRWTESDHLIKNVLDPTFHAIAIASYIFVAVVYFVLPQLRDLVGNSITSMSLCLTASQCASTVQIFKQFGNHVNFLAADIVLYVSLLGAFFWLNALGYYVWNTFRSRNVFLRVTDGRKYCYYSTYVWCSTACIAATAIFAHFTLETDNPIMAGTNISPQERFGWLGLSVIFTTIAFTIIVDLCFALSTAKTIKRMNTYGRIHHKMKYSFRMFVLLFAIMSSSWISLLLSQLKYDALIYCHIAINLIQAILILYVCVFGQRRVTFLLGKTCNCCSPSENVEGLDWGEEMTAINAGY